VWKQSLRDVLVNCRSNIFLFRN